MKHLTLLAALLLSVLLCVPALSENPYFVRKVELPEGFFLGMDVSSVLAEEASGVVYRDEEGNQRDLFELIQENGVNLIRVRVWNDPYDSHGRGFGGGNNDLNAAVAIGQRATKAGMRVLIDFHYSDFWADPSKQQAPRAWAKTSMRQKPGVLEKWTREALTVLRDAGVDVAMVQLGNETNGWMCGEKNWVNIYKLMAAGSRAVREVFPEALIAVHFANPENGQNYLNWAHTLMEYGLDYDVFGTSYYPWWHGTIENLKGVLTDVQALTGKKVMVMETSYAWTLKDGDLSGNSIGEGGIYEKPYPVGIQGQINEVTDVAQAMADIGGIGLCYWEGAWVPVGQTSYEENALKWETYGSGWASSYAGEYDPKDAGVYYGGSACDNQTLFDFDGRTLPSLKVFSLMKTGQEAPLQVDALDDAVLEADINGEIVFPASVSAVMNDNTRQTVPVVWEPVDLSAMRAAGPNRYTLHGTADGQEATLLLSLIKYNFLKNGGFEEDDLSMWRCEDHAQADELYCEEKKSDSRAGLRHWHFYSAQADHVDFDLTQDVTGLPEGTYTFSAALMGGDTGEQDIYLFVQINGETVATASGQMTAWAQWDVPEIHGIRVASGDTVTVGIHVTCRGAGAWGKIDAAALNSEN